MTLSDYRSLFNAGDSMGRVLKKNADMIIKQTWDRDIDSQIVYLYDDSHDKSDERHKLDDLHSSQDENKIPVKIKFIRHGSQSYEKDPVTYWLQLQPGYDMDVPYYDEVFGKRYKTLYPIGLYCDVMDERGRYNRWLVADKANYDQNQFPTFELLRCDYLFQWVDHDKRYEMPGAMRSQNSYNNGLNAGTIIQTGNDMQKFCVPLNDVTETLSYNHRIIIDAWLHTDVAVPRVWKVSKLNRVMPNGIARIMLTQDLFNPHSDVIERDEDGNVTGMWADAIDAHIPVAEEMIQGVLTASGKNNQIKIGGSYKTIKAEFPNGDVPDSWEYTIDGQDATALLSFSDTNNSNSVRVKFMGDDTYIGKTILVKCNSNGKTASIKLLIQAL